MALVGQPDGVRSSIARAAFPRDQSALDQPVHIVRWVCAGIVAAHDQFSWRHWHVADIDQHQRLRRGDVVDRELLELVLDEIEATSVNTVGQRDQLDKFVVHRVNPDRP